MPTISCQITIVVKGFFDESKIFGLDSSGFFIEKEAIKGNLQDKFLCFTQFLGRQTSALYA